MSGPRLRRLVADLAGMRELRRQAPIDFRADGDPPERYELIFNTPGLARENDTGIVLRNVHRCEIYLHHDYPRRPPVTTWLTPILHPNILGPERNGGVCIGSWSAGESLADLSRRLLDLVAYRSFNLVDALDRDAAHAVGELGLAPGVDLQRAVAELDRALAPSPEVRMRSAA